MQDDFDEELLNLVPRALPACKHGRDCPHTHSESHNSRFSHPRDSERASEVAGFSEPAFPPFYSSAPASSAHHHGGGGGGKERRRRENHKRRRREEEEEHEDGGGAAAGGDFDFGEHRGPAVAAGGRGGGEGAPPAENGDFLSEDEALREAIKRSLGEHGDDGMSAAARAETMLDDPFAVEIESPEPREKPVAARRRARERERNGSIHATSGARVAAKSGASRRSITKGGTARTSAGAANRASTSRISKVDTEPASQRRVGHERRRRRVISTKYDDMFSSADEDQLENLDQLISPSPYSSETDPDIPMNDSPTLVSMSQPLPSRRRKGIFAEGIGRFSRDDADTPNGNAFVEIDLTSPSPVSSPAKAAGRPAKRVKSDHKLGDEQAQLDPTPTRRSPHASLPVPELKRRLSDIGFDVEDCEAQQELVDLLDAVEESQSPTSRKPSDAQNADRDRAGGSGHATGHLDGRQQQRQNEHGPERHHQQQQQQEHQQKRGSEQQDQRQQERRPMQQQQSRKTEAAESAKSASDEVCSCSVLSKAPGVACILHGLGVQSANRYLLAAQIPPSPASPVSTAQEDPVDTRTHLELMQHACAGTQRDVIQQVDVNKWLKATAKDKNSLVTLLCDINLVNAEHGNSGPAVLGMLQGNLKNIRVKTVATDSHSSPVLKSHYVSTFVWMRQLSSRATIEAQDKEDVPSMLSEEERRQIVSCNKYRAAVLLKYVHEQELRQRLETRSSPANKTAAVPIRYRPARVTPVAAKSASDPSIHELTEPFVARRMMMHQVAVLHADNQLIHLVSSMAKAAQHLAGVSGTLEQNSANSLSHHHLYRAFLVIEGSERWFSEQSRIRNEVHRKRMVQPGAPIPQEAALSPNLKSRADIDALCTTLQMQYQVQVRLTQSPDETAKFIQDLTVAIVEAPYRAEAEFHNFCSITAKKSAKKSRPTGRSMLKPQDISSWNTKTHEKFCDMLLQITGIGFPVAIAVVRKFGSPGSLVRAYNSQSLNQRAKEQMLENEMCYTGRNSNARQQRIGPKRSRQIFRFFTCAPDEADTLMTDL